MRPAVEAARSAAWALAALGASMACGCGLVLDLDAPDPRGLDASTADASLSDAALSDAAAADAAAADATSADAAADASPDASLPSGCEELHPAAIFCDDFEELPPFARWDRVRGMVSHTSSPVQRGSGAAHVAIVATESTASLDVLTLPETRTGELFVRAYFWLPSEAPAEGVALLHVEERGDPWGYVEVALTGGALQLRTGASTFDTPSAEVAGAAMPRERWVCLEMRVLVSDLAGEVELFVDDFSHLRASGLDTLPALPYGTLYAGMPERAAGVQTLPSEIYLDEVVVSRARIGCASP